MYTPLRHSLLEAFGSALLPSTHVTHFLRCSGASRSRSAGAAQARSWGRPSEHVSSSLGNVRTSAVIATRTREQVLRLSCRDENGRVLRGVVQATRSRPVGDLGGGRGVREKPTQRQERRVKDGRCAMRPAFSPPLSRDKHRHARGAAARRCSEKSKAKRTKLSYIYNEAPDAGECITRRPYGRARDADPTCPMCDSGLLRSFRVSR